MTREGVRLPSALAPPKRISMKETKFAAPCFVLRRQLEFGGSFVQLCLAGSRRGCHCSRGASAGLLLCPLPFIASRTARERFCLLLTAADLADRLLPGGSAGWDFQVGHLRGGAGRAQRGLLVTGLFLPGPLLRVKPRHLVTFTGPAGSGFTPHPGSVTRQRRKKADEDASPGHVSGGAAALREGAEPGPSAYAAWKAQEPTRSSGQDSSLLNTPQFPGEPRPRGECCRKGRAMWAPEGWREPLWCP